MNIHILYSSAGENVHYACLFLKIKSQQIIFKRQNDDNRRYDGESDTDDKGHQSWYCDRTFKF